MGLRFSKQNEFLNDEIVDFYIPNFKYKSEICVGATELCKKYCYGNCVYRHSDNPEKKTLSTETIAIENYKITKTESFVDDMDALIKKTGGISRIRIHSIGDFYSYDYFKKWIKIIKRNPQKNFTAYVKNFEVLEEYKKNNGKIYDNFNILLSLFPDTYDKYKSKGGKNILMVCSKNLFLIMVQKNMLYVVESSLKKQ